MRKTKKPRPFHVNAGRLALAYVEDDNGVPGVRVGIHWLHARRLRALAKWLNQAADWMDE